MMDIATVCNVFDAPAVKIAADSDAILTEVRVKSLDTGRLLLIVRASPRVVGESAYLQLPGFSYGETVAFEFRQLSWEAVRTWFLEDSELPFRTDSAPEEHPVTADPDDGACDSAAPAETEETASEPEQAPDEGEEKPPFVPTGEDVLEIMRTQDRSMTVREIVLCLGLEVSSETRREVTEILESLETNGTVRRDGKGTTAAGGRPTLKWVIA